MDEFQDPGSAAVLAHFLLRVREDRAHGTARSREAYLALYPEHAVLIGRELDALLEPPASAASDAPRFGAYRVLHELGRGGQAEVYLAEDTRLCRRVALKVLRGLGSISPERLERFRREALAASRIDHPAICTVYESGVEGGIPYLAMRYVEGETLSSRLAAARDAGLVAGASGTERALELFEKIALAVHAAHEAGILHRDLKPQNVIVTPAGEPVVLDFGLAADLSGDLSSLTRSGDRFGTPHYMAPEQIQGRTDLGRAVDVWALGVSLYEALTLRRPFEAPTPEALMQQILRVEAPSLRRASSRFSKDLATVVATALAKEPVHRYRTALDLAEDLARVRRGEPIRARRTGPLVRSLRWARREPVQFAAVALATAFVGVMGYLLARWPELRLGAEESRRARIEAELEHAFIELSEGHQELARASFESALALDRESTEALAGLALAYDEDKQTELGLRAIELRGASTRDPDALSLVRAELLRHAGRETEALALETAGPPRSPIALFFAAKLALGASCSRHDADRGAAKRARDLMLQCVYSAPVARRLYHFELAHALKHADPQAALVAVKGLEYLWSDCSGAWFWIGFCLPASEPERRIAAYRRALELNPMHASAWTNLGKSLKDAGRLEEAQAAFEKTISLRHDLYCAYDGLARIHHDRGEYDRAIAIGRMACIVEPNYPKLISQLGIYYEDSGDLNAAEEQYRESLRLDGAYDRGHLLLGCVLYQKGLFVEALEHLRRVPENEVSDPSGFQIRIARCCNTTGDFAGAAAAYRKALLIRPDDAEAHCNLGHVSRRLGEFTAAEASFRRGHELSRPRTDWGYPSARWLANAERLLELERQLAEDEEQTLENAGPEDRALLAEIAVAKGRHALAAELWSQAFEAEPKLAEMLATGWRERAAMTAALAGASAQDPSECERWISQSLAWLEQDLAAMRRSRERGTITSINVRDRLRRWQSDPDLACVREGAAGGMRSSGEAERIQTLWQAVEEFAEVSAAQAFAAPTH